jgi:hypothetical protein
MWKIIVPQMAQYSKYKKAIKISVQSSHMLPNLFLTYKAHFTIVHNSFKNDSDGDGYVRSY